MSVLEVRRWGAFCGAWGRLGSVHAVAHEERLGVVVRALGLLASWPEGGRMVMPENVDDRGRVLSAWIIERVVESPRAWGVAENPDVVHAKIVTDA